MMSVALIAHHNRAANALKATRIELRRRRADDARTIEMSEMAHAGAIQR